MEIIKLKSNRIRNNESSVLKSRIIIHTYSEIHIVSKSAIIFLKADSNYSIIEQNNGSSIMTSKTLKSFCERLGNSFLRVHQSYLVNPQYIKTVSSSMDLLTLHNGAQIPISRAKRKLVQDFLNAYFD